MSSQFRAPVGTFQAEGHLHMYAMLFSISTYHPFRPILNEKADAVWVSLLGNSSHIALGDFPGSQKRSRYVDSGCSHLIQLLHWTLIQAMMLQDQPLPTAIPYLPKKLSQTSWQVHHPEPLSKLRERLLTHISLRSPISTQTICNPNSSPVRTGPAPVTSHKLN